MRISDTDTLNRSQYSLILKGTLQPCTSIWTLRLRRNKMTILKSLLLLSLIFYLILLYKSRREPDEMHSLDSNLPIDGRVRDPHLDQDSISKKSQYQPFKSNPVINDFSSDSISDSFILKTKDPTNSARPAIDRDSHRISHEFVSSTAQNHIDNDSKKNEDHLVRPDVRISSTSSKSPERRRLDVSLDHPKLFKKLNVIRNRLDQSLKRLMPTVQGWGEDGQGVTLETTEEKEAAAAVFNKGAYNVYISDRISPNRTLRSVVAPSCENVKYDVRNLPNVSVIIIFTDEIFSALIRTVWSVINRTPKNLLHEIIMVDDFSSADALMQPLEDYIQVYWPNLVRLYRQPSRRGLIQARLKGAREAKGDVLLFLDSHCEVTDRWLEPLLARIKENPKVFICPVIDIINDKSLEYNAVDPYSFQVGGFDWTGHFTWISRPDEDMRKNPTKAVKSPTMAGGLFAVDRKIFFEFGSYDEDMQIWGGENLEISFRAWQCGGRVEIHPCSHVGHIFRDYHPYSFKGVDSHGINTLRTVLVWMDDYKRYFFMARPDLKSVKPGSLDRRLQLKKDLNCVSFKDYLRDVYENRKFIFDQNVTAYGYVRNPASNLCIDTLNRREDGAEDAGLYSCESMNIPVQTLTNQLFSMTHSGEIRREETCLTAPTTTNGNKHVKMLKCSETKRTKRRNGTKQQWRHEKNGQIINTATNECLTTRDQVSESYLMISACDEDDDRQKWIFFKYDSDSTHDDPNSDDYAY